MLVVIPVSSHDFFLASSFCKLVRFLGPYQEHSLLVVCRPSDYEEGKKVFEELNQDFGEASFFQFQSEGSKGWPAGPNFYWVSTIEYLNKTVNKLPWFWMELDTTPIKRNWLNFLEGEYQMYEAPLLGNICHSIYRNIPHLNGVAVYPYNFSTLFSCWENVLTDSRAFDVYCADEIIKYARGSVILQNNFRSMNYFNGALGIQGESANGDSRSPMDLLVKPASMVVHGCVDGSLADIILKNESIK
jgi:hypothetical protein